MEHKNIAVRNKTTVSASDLSQMGVCERLVRFEAQYGKRPSHLQREAMARGSRAHAQFLRDGLCSNPTLKTSVEKPWCFIATAVFGPQAAETQTLRMFRDRILRKSAAGRALVRMYYRMSPGIGRWLAGRKWATFVMRALLRPLVVAAGAVVTEYTEHAKHAKRSKDKT
jgi:hypothetical protein